MYQCLVISVRGAILSCQDCKKTIILQLEVGTAPLDTPESGCSILRLLLIWYGAEHDAGSL